MKDNKVYSSTLLFLLTLFIIIQGCVATNQAVKERTINYSIDKPEPTVASYEAFGNYWGKKHLEQNIRPGCLEGPCLKSCCIDITATLGCFDKEFIKTLIDKERLNFFWVHSDLKDAFKKGYRFGFQDRTADLVLGPHLTVAAACIGNAISAKFVNVIEIFETGWAETLKRAIDIFIVLISEGSQADRENFIREFTSIYANKYNKNQDKIRAGGFLTKKSEGGTVLYIDARKTLTVLNIPTPPTLKAEIYLQAFRVMGDEWGKRLSHNLIKRSELIDLLRRSKTALQEVPENKKPIDRLKENMGIIYGAFISSYGTDA